MTTTEIILAIGMIGSWVFAYFKFRNEKGNYKRDEFKSLIETLTQHKDELTSKVDQLIEENKEYQSRLAKVEGEYNSLVKIFQGRDETIVDYQQKGRKAFEQVAEIHTNTEEIKEFIVNIKQTSYKDGTSSTQTVRRKDNDNP